MDLALTVEVGNFGFPEGPVAMADGSLLFVDIKNELLGRSRGGGQVETVAKLEGGPNGVAIGPDGAAYVCNNGGVYNWGKFGAATYGQIGPMVAEAASRAARGHVLYLELMITPDGVASSQIGQEVGWDGNFEGTLDKLKRKGIAGAATAGVQALLDAEAEKNRLLKCGTPQADQGS